jgi:Mn2+/Fe2+ NRAMP family transporter
MGQYTNTLAKNIIAWATVVTLIGLTALMLASVVLPLFGVPFLQ